MHIPRASLWMVREVVDEYGFGSMPTLLAPKVLDLGANVGVFTLACCNVWPEARVMCFEPHPETFQILKHNVFGLPVEAHQMAVVGYQRPLSLHEGKRNRLCCSLRDVGDQDMSSGIEVNGYLAAELPPCDLLKIDTEGCELEILEAYRHLRDVKLLLCEVHGITEKDKKDEAQNIADLAHRAGMMLLEHRGSILRFAR